MILPVSDVLTTPSLTSKMDPKAREKLKEKYRLAKKYGIKAAWASVTGSGILELGKEALKGEIITRGKKKSDH